MKCASYWVVAVLLAAAPFLAGCESSTTTEDESTETTTVFTNSASDEAFAQIIPTGLLSDRYSIKGTGTSMSFLCDEIAGAVSYTFSTSLGSSDTVQEPLLIFNVTSDNPGAVTFEVYATNLSGTNTQTASALSL